MFLLVRTLFPCTIVPVLERERLRVRKAFLCMRTMGVLVPSLHRESTDSQIVKLDATQTCHIQIYQRLQQLLLRYANLKLIGVASRGLPSRAYRLRHMTITITNMVSKYGKLSGPSSFCPFGKVLRVLLAQIVLCSDYSGSMKQLW